MENIMLLSKEQNTDYNEQDSKLLRKYGYYP